MSALLQFGGRGLASLACLLVVGAAVRAEASCGDYLHQAPRLMPPLASPADEVPCTGPNCSLSSFPSWPVPPAPTVRVAELKPAVAAMAVVSPVADARRALLADAPRSPSPAPARIDRPPQSLQG